MTATSGPRPAASLLALALCCLSSSCATDRSDTTAAPARTRFYPAPTSSLFTPAPFALPNDGRSFWAALREVTSRLRPSPAGSGDERARLQACDHLAQLVNLVIEDDTRDYDISGFASAQLNGLAFDCQDPTGAEVTYLRLERVLEADPYAGPQPGS